MKFEWDLSELTEFADRLVGSDLENTFERITKDIGKALLKRMKSLTPVGDTYDLINGWNGNQFVVTEKNNGYEVLIINRDEKAPWVNDGHRSFNKLNAGTDNPYKVHTRKQVRSPYKWQLGDGTHWVYGHFFVERGILQLKNTSEIEAIIMRELQKWWDSV